MEERNTVEASELAKISDSAMVNKLLALAKRAWECGDTTDATAVKARRHHRDKKIQDRYEMRRGAQQPQSH